MATTATQFLMPIYLISLRGIEEGAAGGVLFLTSLGMGMAAQTSGRLSDRFGPRRFAVAGFGVLVATALPMAFVTEATALPVVMALLFVSGLGMGLWNVPNNSMILGAVPLSSLGVVGAFTNLTRNVGNVTGQAIASGVIVAVMAANGFDIPLSEIATRPGAAGAFVDGWRIAYLLVTAYAAVGLLLATQTKPAFERVRHAPTPATRSPGGD
jgi:MFS family permease